MKRVVLSVAALMAVFAFMSCGKGKSEGSMSKKPVGPRPVVTMETSMGNVKIELWNDIAPNTVENFVGLAQGTKEWKDPKTSQMVKKPFYDGLVFHRVIKDFMIQGGCPLGTGSGGPGFNFADECYGEGKEISSIENEEDAKQIFQSIIVPYLRNNPNPDPAITDILKECQLKNSGQPLMRHDVEWYAKKVGHKGPVYSQKLLAKVEYGTICMANAGPNTNGSQFFIVTKKEGCEWLNGKHTVFGKVIEGMDIVDKIQAVKVGAQDKPVTPVVIKKITVEVKNEAPVAPAAK